VEPSEGYRLIGELARRVAPGGVGALQIPLRPGTRRARVFFWATARIPFVANVWNLVRGRPWSYPRMRMTAYRLDRVLEQLASHGVAASNTVHHPATGPMEFHSVTVLLAAADR
jgi:hypothetical protein